MTRYLRVAAFVLVSVLLTSWIALEIAGVDRGTDRYTLQARFDDATNLKKSDPVKLAGVAIGRVASVELERGQALVRFTVDRSVSLPVDTIVAVRSQDLLGRRLLRVEPGDSPTFLVDGDTIGQTVSAIELGALINELGPLLEAVRPERVNALVIGLNEALSGNQATVADLTVDLATLLDTLASRSGTIATLIDDYGVLIDEMASRDSSIQQLLDNLLRLSETFAASEGVLVQALDTLPGVADDLRDLLVLRADDLDIVLSNLASIGSDVRAQLDDVDAIAAQLPDVLVALFSIVDDGEFVNLNFNCVSNAPPPCPHSDVGDEQSETDDLAAILQDLLTP